MGCGRRYIVKTAQDAPGQMEIPRQDVALFMADLVENTAWDGQMVSLFSAD